MLSAVVPRMAANETNVHLQQFSYTPKRTIREM